MGRIGTLIAYTLGILKHTMFSEDAGARKSAIMIRVATLEVDVVNYSRNLLLDLRTETATYLFFPLLYPVHTVLEEGTGVTDSSGTTKLPAPLRLTSASLDPKGIYLLDNGLSTFIWLGEACDPRLAKTLRAGFAEGAANEDVISR